MKSTFQFTDPKLLSISFDLNKDFKTTSEGPIQIPITSEVEIKEGPDNNSAFVILHVVVGSDDAKTPFIVKADEGAAFRWESTEISGVPYDRLLHQNAPALLLSYLRPIIAMVTAASPFTAYNIPFMNFADNSADKIE